MSSYLLLSLFGLLALADPAPVATGGWQPTCPYLFSASGVLANYAESVSHSIHSLTVDDLRKFEPTVTEKNKVPTVNLDLKSDQLVLAYAPDVKYPSGDKYLTEDMKVLDEVFSHGNDPSYNLAAYNSLERAVHSFHMREIWDQILRQYQQIKANPAIASEQVCSCLLDTENNGIMKLLVKSAQEIRFRPANGNSAASHEHSDNGYFFGKQSKDLAVRSSSTNGHDHAKGGMPPLINSSAWAKWRELTKAPEESYTYATAMYLYCSLNSV